MGLGSDYDKREHLYDGLRRPREFADQQGDTVTPSYDLASRLTKGDYRTAANSPSGTIADTDEFAYFESQFRIRCSSPTPTKGRQILFRQFCACDSVATAGNVLIVGVCIQQFISHFIKMVSRGLISAAACTPWRNCHHCIGHSSG